MFKAVILLTRRADMTHDEFAQWWLGEHRPLAQKLPNLRKAIFNLVDHNTDDPGIDGVSELWFDSKEDFEAAYASEMGIQTAEDSIAHVSNRVRMFVVENEFLGS